MARTCSICAHRKHQLIDTLLRSGTPYRDIEERCKPASRSALQRHKRECLRIVMGQIMGQTAPHNGTTDGDNGTLVVVPLCSPLTIMEPASTQVLPAIDGPQVTENPFSQFKRGLALIQEAVRLAADDPPMVDRMRFLINEALQSDEMGL